MNQVTTAVHIVMPQDCNGYAKPRLFGGQLMAWIDVLGAVTARRFAKANVTTVCVDHLTFLEGAYLNDTVVQEGRVTWSGRTSLEVRVDSYVERLDGERQLVNRAYMVFVALDDDDKPIPVPKYTPETLEEQYEFSAALNRQDIRKQERAENARIEKITELGKTEV